jgi:diguanylate cyclase (GGDEF)-like protein
MQYFQIKDYKGEKEACFKDKITNLNNAVGLIYLLEYILKQHKRYEENWSLIVLDTDIEHVKTDCKDTTAQDEIEKVVADALRKTCRNSDILAYLGSAKFCVLSRVFEGDDTVRFADKLLKHLKQLEYKSCKIEIEVKAGITFTKYEDNAEDVFERLDKALVQANKTDKNIVVLV